MLFEKILFGSVCVSALILFINRFVLGKRFDKKNPVLEPWPVDYARSLFPVFLAVFIMRSFIFEPFRIPSSSMMPTLEIGDFLLVNKFTYGIRLPIVGKKVMSINDPERGDIFVFKYPKDTSQNYIKRVMGLPGDTIEYSNKRLFINKREVIPVSNGSYEFFDASMSKHKNNLYTTTLDNGRKHDLLLNPVRGSSSGRWIVPKGHYFAMGDNRDHSADSRSWGFVPDENIVGKAFFIWFHYDSVTDRGFNFSRIGEPIYQ
jgi:signal peptidase I